jgi:hypothetical protein
MGEYSMTREEITQILQDKDKTFICDVIIRLIEGGNIDITDFNSCYINTLQKRLNEKDRIIQEADNCIFNSLFYDSIGKTDSNNVILDKVRWRYRYADTNKETLCKTFNYDADRDVINEHESVEEFVGVLQSPSKTFPKVNQFEIGASYRR